MERWYANVYRMYRNKRPVEVPKHLWTSLSAMQLTTVVACALVVEFGIQKHLPSWRVVLAVSFGEWGWRRCEWEWCQFDKFWTMVDSASMVIRTKSFLVKRFVYQEILQILFEERLSKGVFLLKKECQFSWHHQLLVSNKNVGQRHVCSVFHWLSAAHRQGLWGYPTISHMKGWRDVTW